MLNRYKCSGKSKFLTLTSTSSRAGKASVWVVHNSICDQKSISFMMVHLEQGCIGHIMYIDVPNLIFEIIIYKLVSDSSQSALFALSKNFIHHSQL